MMLHLILIGAGLALGLVLGAWIMHAVYERDGGRMDAAYDEGVAIGLSSTRSRAEVADTRPDPPRPAPLAGRTVYPQLEPDRLALAALVDEDVMPDEARESPAASAHKSVPRAEESERRNSRPGHPEDTGTFLARSYESGLSMLALGAATEADERHADVAGFAEIRRQLAAVAA